jgi:hypothetical protein
LEFWHDRALAAESALSQAQAENERLTRALNEIVLWCASQRARAALAVPASPEEGRVKYLSVRVTDETGEELFAARTDDASPANGHITVTWKADGTVSLTVAPDEAEQIVRPADDTGRFFLCRSTDPTDTIWADTPAEQGDQ